MNSSADQQQQLPAYYSQVRPEVVRLVDAPGKRILEVGCAAGAMGAALLKAGAREVVGIDIFGPALELARERLSAAHQLDLNTLPALPYPDGRFDYITFADVLEHLVDPVKVLRHMRRYLAPGGHVLVSIPNVRHESVVLPLLVDGQWEYQDWGILDRTHLRFYTRTGVRKMIADAGFFITGSIDTTRTDMPHYIGKAAELVKALGGHVQQFLADANVVQFVFLAAPADARPELKVAGDDIAPAPAQRDQWHGSQKVRVLLTPQEGESGWGEVLTAIVSELDGQVGFTIGIALPLQALESPPSPIPELARKAGIDLRLTEAPSDVTGWSRLLRGTTVYISTSGESDLTTLARSLGVEVREVAPRQKSKSC
jgi:2-polyprenyl-3-methyl-5-hydroxy-6-metoxy-1,4-benzoquinol methylase